jgi:uncharacterized protein
MRKAFPTLEGERYVSLVTFRKTGKAVPTPVWGAEQDGRMYVQSNAQAGKVKRIRNNAKVELAPCTVRGRVTGTPVEGRARILGPGEQKRARTALLHKYGWQMRTLLFLQKLGRRQPAYLEITPAS